MLCIRLISGQHLPKPPDQLDGGIIQPFVKVRVVGHAEDEKDWESTVVPKNGFNPVWDEVAEFRVTMPELAILEFEVRRYYI